MAASPVLSPRPNPPGTKVVNPAKAKALAILNNSKAAEAKSIASTPGDAGQDIADQMNDEVRRQFVSGKRLGEGTYAIVYEGHYRHDPSAKVAIKKIKLNAEFKDGIAMDAMREIKHLSELSFHPNIIQLHAVFSTKDQNLSLVLEHLPCGDLEQLWRNHSIPYGSADIKSWANMLCQAVWFCHENFVLHRDIKGNNCLIAADGTVKLADFGLAKSFADPGRRMTSNVITRFYRPPELLYGCDHYGGKVDIWSVGCVIAELATRDWFLPSNTDIEQIAVICDVFGTPTEDSWPGVTKLKHYLPPAQQATANPTANGSTAPKKPQPLAYWRQRFPLLGEDGIDLIRGMLMMDPNKRLSAEEALKHRYWTNAPRPTKKENLPMDKKDGEKKMAEDLKRKGGEVPAESGRADKVARKLDFGAMKK